MKIVTIIGARPQFVKAAVVSRAFLQNNHIEEIIIHTGQHYDPNMSAVFFEEMNIPQPHFNLNINGLTHGSLTGKMLTEIEQLLINIAPDWVLVYGDTDSTLAGALAAAKLNIPLAHVEAGLRSFNMQMPEEINRILTDRISNILFCPTDTAIKNLQKEGFEHFSTNIIKSGDVMFDAALFYAPKAQKPTIDIPQAYILCTIHRKENISTIENLKKIFDALEDIAQSVPIVLPLHPHTRHQLQEIGYNLEKSNICIIEPVGYFEMIYLLQHSLLVMTDSGGLQKEAYFFQKKCVTLRQETEWVELVNCGCNQLIGNNDIISVVQQMLNKQVDFSKQLYGNGHAGEIIAKTLMNA